MNLIWRRPPGIYPPGTALDALTWSVRFFGFAVQVLNLPKLARKACEGPRRRRWVCRAGGIVSVVVELLPNSVFRGVLRSRFTGFGVLGC